MERDEATERDAERQRRKRGRDAAGMPAPRCGAKTRSGGRCKLPAGHATDHPGFGVCSRHSGSTRAQRQAAYRAELLAEARAWAVDQSADPGELMLGLVRATSAHAALVERRVHALAPEDPDLVLWSRTLDQVHRTASDTAARALALGLEERRARVVERVARDIAGAAERGLEALAVALGAPITAEAQLAFAQEFGARITALELEPGTFAPPPNPGGAQADAQGGEVDRDQAPR